MASLQRPLVNTYSRHPQDKWVQGHNAPSSHALPPLLMLTVPLPACLVSRSSIVPTYQRYHIDL